MSEATQAIVSKFNTKKVSIIAYIVLSAIFIVYILYKTFETNVMQSSYQQGYLRAYAEVVSNAKNEKCQSFVVNYWNDKAELVNIACLQKAQWWAGAAPAEQPAK